MRRQKEMLALAEEQLRQQQQLADELRRQNAHLQEQQTALAERLEKLEEKAAQTEDLLGKHRSDTYIDHWKFRTGYDISISALQLAQIELAYPGNRERLQALHNTHKGERCFVLGNGPSLQAADLDILKKNGIFTLSSNRIAAIFSQTDWRPDVWCTVDVNNMYHYPREWEKHPDSMKFLPIRTSVEYKYNVPQAYYFPFLDDLHAPTWFDPLITQGVHNWSSVTGVLINIAAYLGFTEIYLLGVDHSVPLKKDEQGRIYFDFDKKMYFSDEYHTAEFRSKDAAGVSDHADILVHKVGEAYAQIKFHCDLLGIHSTTQPGAASWKCSRG